MRSLKAMLAELSGSSFQRLALMSGRRPRLESDQGAVRQLGDEILSDEDVLGICKAAGGGRRLDTLSERAITWTYLSEIGPTTVTASLRGREVAASFELSDARRAADAGGAGASAGPSSRRRRTAEIAAVLGRSTERDPRADPRTESEARGRPTRRSLTAQAAERIGGRALRGDEPPVKRASLPPGSRRRSLAALAAVLDAASLGDSRREDREPGRGGRPPERPVRRATPPRAPARALDREEPKSSKDARLDPREDAPKRALSREPERTGSPPLATLGPLTLDAPTLELDMPPPKRDPAPARAPEGLRAEAPPAPPLQPPPEPTSTLVTALSPKASAPARAPELASGKTPPSPTAAPSAPALAPKPAPSPAAQPHERAVGPRVAPDPALLQLVRLARQADASDVHLTAGRPPRARVKGELAELGRGLRGTSGEDIDRMRASILPARLAEGYEQLGSAEFAIDLGSEGRVRVSASRTLAGARLALRLLPGAPKTLAELGLPEDIVRALEHHQGLVVVAGPTGHGKTTTLAALVDHVNETRASHVITIEDPIEIVHASKRSVVSQREVGRHAKSFARALEGALRQDPDVVVVGELRDTETVRMALAASETGHLVLVTMNTPSAARALEHLIDLFPTEEQPQVRITLAAALRLVTCQRLVPGVEGNSRHAAVELLPGGMALGSLIRDGKTYQLPALMQRGRGAGIVRLDDSLVDLVKSGAVTEENARAASPDPEAFARLLEGRDASVAPSTVEELNQEDSKLRGLLQRAGAIFGGGRKDGER